MSEFPNPCGGYYCSQEHGHIDCVGAKYDALQVRNTESIRLLSLCLAHLRTTEHKAEYESACRLCGVKPYEQEEPK